MQPGIIRIYNRLPYKVECTFDCISYEIAAHEEDYVTLPFARCAMMASLWKVNPDNALDVEHGVVPDNHPEFGNPLTEEDVTEANPVRDTQGHGLSWGRTIQANGAGLMPRGSIDPKSFAIAGKL